jgi:hypothetical protein
MKTTISLEIECEVDFDYQPAERMTRHYPGCHEAVEINTLLLNEKEISMETFNIMMEMYQGEIEQACWDEVRDQEQEREIIKAEYRRYAKEEDGWK